MAKSDIVLRNGTIVTPDGVVKGGIAIRGETIAHVGPDAELGDGVRSVDLDGKVVLPGLFDPHTHFGAGGSSMTYEILARDFANETKDCLIGGVTTFATTTLIGPDIMELHTRAREVGDRESWIDYKLTSVVLNEKQLDALPALTQAGVVDYKFFTGYMGAQAAAFGMGENGVPFDLFYKAVKILRDSSPRAFAKIHAEDPYIRGMLIDEAGASGKPESTVEWAKAHPEYLESMQLYPYSFVANAVGIPIYPVHISSKVTVDSLAELQKRGMDITAETIVLFLLGTAEELDARGFSKEGKIQPAVRHQADQDRLWKGIQDGIITVIGTDSVPHTREGGFKDGGFWNCKVGVNNQMIDSLPLLFDKGVNGGRIDLMKLAELTSTNAAKIYGIFPKKGAIQAGSDADLVVVDPDRTMRLGVDRCAGLSDYSLWEGKEVKGAPVLTIFRGEVVVEDGAFVAQKPRGRYIVG